MRIRTVRSSRKPRRGFSLTEVLVALTLLSIILMGLARVTFQMASASKTNDAFAKRNATLIEEANKFNAMAFDSLATVSTTTRTLTFGDFKFERRLVITSNTSVYKTIKIVITPYIAGVLTPSRKDSVWISRTKPAGSPLCTSC